MVDCMECTNFIECHYSGQLTGRLTSCPDFKQKPMTNAQKIRAMTDEELAVMLADHENKVAFEVCCSFALPSVGYDFEESINELLNWLKQPAEGDA